MRQPDYFSRTILPKEFFHHRLTAELALFRRTGLPLACIALVVQSSITVEGRPPWAEPVVRLLVETCRPSDSIWDIGDGTYAVLAPATRAAKASALIARMSHRLPGLLSLYPVTWGFGVARPIGQGDTDPFRRAAWAAEAAAAHGHGVVKIAA